MGKEIVDNWRFYALIFAESLVASFFLPIEVVRVIMEICLWIILAAWVIGSLLALYVQRCGMFYKGVHPLKLVVFWLFMEIK